MFSSSPLPCNLISDSSPIPIRKARPVLHAFVSSAAERCYELKTLKLFRDIFFTLSAIGYTAATSPMLLTREGLRRQCRRGSSEVIPLCLQSHLLTQRCGIG